jgi:hypothetical protein
MYIACLCILNLHTYSTKAGGLFKCPCCGGGGGFRRRAYGATNVVDGDVDDVHHHTGG